MDSGGLGLASELKYCFFFFCAPSIFGFGVAGLEALSL